MEGYGPATYGDGIADAYDQWYGALPETADTVEALAALASSGDGKGRVLELGIGSGRLALPLATRGFEVWGIDIRRPWSSCCERRTADAICV